MMLEPLGVEGQVAVVSGASGGIGRAVVETLRAGGALVAALDQHRLDLEPATECCVVDVADPNAVEQSIAHVESSLGPIDIVVNAAGILRSGSAVDMPVGDLEELMRVNFMGVVNVSQATTKRMRRRRQGALVTVASNAGSVPRVDMAAYGATKAAAIYYTQSLGLELGPAGVRCNVVSPGSTDTPMLRSLWTDSTDADAVVAGSPDKYRIGIPLGKLADPSDIADAVAFLVSRRSGHITMHNLCVDGGASLSS